MRFSLICFLVILILGLASMGFLGIGLYYLASPALTPLFPPMESWHGDWVWPAMIMSGMTWSFGFLIAGGTCLSLHRYSLPKPVPALMYLIILWSWDWLIWFLIIRSQPLKNLIP